MSTHNIDFNGEISKIIPNLSSITQLICSTASMENHKCQTKMKYGGSVMLYHGI